MEEVVGFEPTSLTARGSNPRRVANFLIPLSGQEDRI